MPTIPPDARRIGRLVLLSIASASFLIASELRSETHDGPEEVTVTPRPVGFTEDFVRLVALGPRADVVSQGSGTIRGTFSFDFDTGRMSDRDDPNAPARTELDVFWEMKTAIERALEPRNGTLIGVLGARDFDAVTYLDVAEAAVASTAVDGSADGRNRLRAGTVLAIVTSDGRYGKVGITRYGRDLGVRWVVWAGGPAAGGPSGSRTEAAATAEDSQIMTRTFALEAAPPTVIEGLTGTLVAPIEAPALQHMEITAISDAAPGVILDSPQQLNTTILRQLTNVRETRAEPETAIEMSPLMLEMLPWERQQLLTIGNFNFAEVAPTTSGGTNPANAVSPTPVELFSGLLPAVSVTPAEITPVFPRVYADTNRASGIYYYLPRAYSLAWDADVPDARGLGLRIAYEQLATPGETSDAVRMAVLLDAGIDLADLDFARRLVEMQSRRSGFTFRDLRPFPLAAPPAISLVDGLANRFDLDPSQINITALSDALDRIELSWVTDPVTAANIRLALTEGFGLNGAAQFVSPDASAPSPLIPVNVQIASTDAFGWLPFRRDAPIRNAAPFPVRLGHLHALVEEGGRPVIHSWSLGETTLPADGSVMLDTTQVPPEVDSVAERMWMTYALDRSCASCITQTLNQIVIGNVGPPAMQMQMMLLTPLADTESALLQVETRSRFLDPSDRTMRRGPVLTFASDATTQPVGFFFRPGDAETASAEPGSTAEVEEEEPVYQYRVTAIRSTGEPCPGQAWLDASAETTFVGSFQLRQSTGTECGAE